MKCRSCESSNIVEVLSLGNQYLSDFVDPHDPKPPQYPLDLVLCKDCTLVQLKETTPSEALYTPRYGYRSGINSMMVKELHDIVESTAQKVQLFDGDMVVDIGANDGTLLSNYPGNMMRVGVEPITKLADLCLPHCNYVINNFFHIDYFNQAFPGKKAKIITAISMFYDLENPNEFVDHLVQLLDENGILVIQQNYLVGMLQQMAFDNICHEHIEYYTLTSLEKLLNRHGLEVIDVVMNDTNGGSFRVYVKHMSMLKKMRFMERKMNLGNEWTYYLYALKLKKNKDKLHEFVEGEVKKGKKVYVYGASTRGSTLLQTCGLDKKLITAAVERNEEKWGKVYGGMGIPIISEEQARKEKPDYMLVMPWFFRSAIIEREQEYLKAGGHLVFPLPDFEVI